MTRETYRGWSIDLTPAGWMATSPNYDASYEGPEDGWVDNGEKVTAETVEGLREEIDAWIDERAVPLAADFAWPAGKRFWVNDPEPSNHHSALYLVLPTDQMVNVSGDCRDGYDIARAEWMAAVLNAALATDPTPPSEGGAS